MRIKVAKKQQNDYMREIQRDIRLTSYALAELKEIQQLGISVQEARGIVLTDLSEFGITQEELVARREELVATDLSWAEKQARLAIENSKRRGF